MISYTKKFIFQHHGKCAGTSIKNAIKKSAPELRAELRETGQGHLSLEDMYNLIRERGEKPNEYFKFTIVRNPWDRLVSWYYHWTKINNSDMKFEDFAVQRKMPYKNLEKMNFILQFENLKKDWTKLCRRIDIPRVGLPHIQYNTNRPADKAYQEYYTDELRDLVASRQKEVIEKFDYKF